uniref:PPIase cyclophilin-type domain-containing protein n=1 Tax=Heterorhabditis bacteriophora TaxID=37862 RepID=A0A1I7XDT2_HETBA
MFRVFTDNSHIVAIATTGNVFSYEAVQVGQGLLYLLFITFRGDPTGTGHGGESMWGKPFEDEASRMIRVVYFQWLTKEQTQTNLSCKSSNHIFPLCDMKINMLLLLILLLLLSLSLLLLLLLLSNFYYLYYSFITFRPCKYLDKKHTIFGRVVGGQDTLSLIEKIETEPLTDKPGRKTMISLKIAECKHCLYHFIVVIRNMCHIKNVESNLYEGRHFWSLLCGYSN